MRKAKKRIPPVPARTSAQARAPAGRIIRSRRKKSIAAMDRLLATEPRGIKPARQARALAAQKERRNIVPGSRCPLWAKISKSKAEAAIGGLRLQISMCGIPGASDCPWNPPGFIPPAERSLWECRLKKKSVRPTVTAIRTNVKARRAGTPGVGAAKSVAAPLTAWAAAAIGTPVGVRAAPIIDRNEGPFVLRQGLGRRKAWIQHRRGGASHAGDQSHRTEYSASRNCYFHSTHCFQSLVRYQDRLERTSL
jgi:hypothetical protein